MPLAASPLRYPGGKASLMELVSHIIRLNKLQYGHYAEPYAGGCGLALGLLYGGHVSDIHINDIDRGIWTFWHVVLNRTDEFIDLMNRTPVTLDEWRRRRDMQRNQRGLSQLEIAFTTFFLNRTNRSGIIKNAGVIGGLKQSGRYTVDCRFTKRGVVTLTQHEEVSDEGRQASAEIEVTPEMIEAGIDVLNDWAAESELLLPPRPMNLIRRLYVTMALLRRE